MRKGMRLIHHHTQLWQDRVLKWVGVTSDGSLRNAERDKKSLEKEESRMCSWNHKRMNGKQQEQNDVREEVGSQRV